MSGNNAVIEQLRSARHADDALSVLREGSQEARRDRIVEALNDPEFAAGPAELLYTFPHHAVCQREGIVMRVRINEGDDGRIQLGNVEVHEIPGAAPDIAEEVFAAARAAVTHIFEGDFEEAAPLVNGIANALSFKGGLRRRVMSEVAKRTVARNAWWHGVVKQRLGEAAPSAEFNPGVLTVTEGLDELRIFIERLALTTSVAIQKLAECDLAPALESVAASIADDLKYALSALSEANSEDEDELTGIYEGVCALAKTLVLGSDFLATLVNENTTPSVEGEE